MLKPLWALFAAVAGAVVLFGLLVVAMVSGDEPTRSPSVVTSVGIIAVVGVVATLAEQACGASLVSALTRPSAGPLGQ